MNDNLIFENNFQQQIEEIEALEAIYYDEFNIINKLSSFNDNSLNKFQLILSIELPDDGIHFKIINHLNNKNENNVEVIGEYNFKYLPPITITFELPKLYPDNESPNFTISTPWLTKKDISLFCKELDFIIESEKGFPHLFTLCNWIQCDSINKLLQENNNSITLYIENEQNDNIYDKRAIPQCLDIQDTVISLLQYNTQKNIEDFRHNSHLCNLCFEEKNGDDFDFTYCCRKPFCTLCITNMCTMLVKNGSFDLLKCPECSEVFDPSFLKQFLNEQLMERWERLTLQKTLESMNDVHYCPRCEAIVISDEDNFAQCTQCNYAFCSRCLDDYHNNSSCDEIASLMKKARQSKDKDNELKSIQVIQKRAKKCPTCNFYISRTSGCNKMTCTQCGSYFCYCCGKKISGYDHFNGTLQGGCKVFDIVTDDMLLYYRNVRQINNNQNYQQDDEWGNYDNYQRVIVGRSKRCPHCGLQQYKQGRNNDIRCYHCNKHFCFQCLSKIKGTTHFIQSECIQHSDDNL